MANFRFVFAVISTASYFLLSCAPVSAQAFTDESLQRVGLTKVWDVATTFDPRRGTVVGVTQHVSQNKSQTIVAVTSGAQRWVFSSRDLDAFGNPLGAEGAKARAEELIADRKRRFKSAPEMKVETVTTPDVRVFISSNSGYIQALDGETARQYWSTSIGKASFPTTAAAGNDNYVVAVNGTTLYQLNQSKGEVIGERGLRSIPAAAPEVSEGRVFLPVVNSFLEVYSLANLSSPPQFYRTSGITRITPVVWGDAAAWATDRGFVYVANAAETGLRFQVRTNDTITSGPVFLPPDRVFFASVDGYVYFCETDRGAILFRFAAGESIVETPILAERSVFATTVTGRLYSIRAEDGAENWQVEGVKKVLAASRRKLFAVSTRNTLLALDRESGAQLGELGLGQIQHSVTNNQTDRIFLATDAGRIVCLRDLDEMYPVIHVPDPRDTPATVKKPARPVPSKESDKSTEEPTEDGGEEAPTEDDENVFDN